MRFLSTLIYKLAISNNNRFLKLIWCKIRSFYIKMFKDPPCTFNIHGKNLEMPLSHALPSLIKEFPYYDSLPARIASFVRKKNKQVFAIDIGANIGDTVAALSLDGSDCDRYLAVEPNPHFRFYLNKNWSANKQITITDVACTAESSQKSFEIVEKNGTTSLVQNSDGQKMRTMTLDDLINENENFRTFNILKIDTDGYDLQIITGGKETIKKNQPIILFECDSFFSNTDFFNNYKKVVDFLKLCGYDSLLFYDNIGYLIGKFSIDDVQTQRKLLFHQICSKQFYYDVVAITPDLVNNFLESEQQFYLTNLKNTAHYTTVIDVLDLKS